MEPTTALLHSSVQKRKEKVSADPFPFGYVAVVLVGRVGLGCVIADSLFAACSLLSCLQTLQRKLNQPTRVSPWDHPPLPFFFPQIPSMFFCYLIFHVHGLTGLSSGRRSRGSPVTSSKPARLGGLYVMLYTLPDGICTQRSIVLFDPQSESISIGFS